MTEWALLLVVIPAIVVPVVLLFGFAGCDLVFNLNFAGPPSNVSASAESRTAIALRWDYLAMEPARFEVSRKRSQDATFELVTPADFKDTAFTDTGLEEGTSYDYQVVAIALNGGDRSDVVEITASTFGEVFETTLPDETDGPNRCIVQRIEPTRLARSGSRVLLTLQRPSAGDLVINRISLSHAAASGDPYDSDGPPTVLADGGFPLLIPADPAAGTEVLPVIDFALDSTRPLLVAFDLGGLGRVRVLAGVTPGDATAFVSPPTTQEAALADRQTGYTVFNLIFLVQRIDAA